MRTMGVGEKITRGVRFAGEIERVSGDRYVLTARTLDGGTTVLEGRNLVDLQRQAKSEGLGFTINDPSDFLSGEPLLHWLELFRKAAIAFLNGID